MWRVTLDACTYNIAKYKKKWLTFAALNELLLVLAFEGINKLRGTHLLAADRKMKKKNKKKHVTLKLKWANSQGFLVEKRHNCVRRARGVDETKVLRRGHFAGPPDLGVVDLYPNDFAIGVLRLLRRLVAKARHGPENSRLSLACDFFWNCRCVVTQWYN